MADETPAPTPAEDAQQHGGSVDEIIARAIEGAVNDAGGEGGESPTSPPVKGLPELPSSGEPNEPPGSETLPSPGESDAPGLEESEPGDSPSLDVGGQKFSQSELAAIVEAHANREAFNKAAQERAEKITQQVDALEQAHAKIQSEQAELAKAKSDNEVYANYLSWLNEGNTGDIREFSRQTGVGTPQAPSPPQSSEDLDARIARVLDRQLGQHQQQVHQREIQSGIDGWVASAVAAEPALKGRETAYQSEILHKLVMATGEQKLTPFDFPAAQIQAFLRQYAREAAQNETKLSETTLADRLAKAARTKEKLPAAPGIHGTPLPVQPNGFKMNLRELAEKTPDIDTYFQKLGDGLKEQADELSSMANRLG